MMMQNTRASLIGVPLDLGAKNLGVDIGPEAFRHQQIVEKLTGVGFTIEDLGNLLVTDRKELEPGNPKLKYLNGIVRANEELANKVEAFIRNGQKAVVIGGDHSLNLGTVAGEGTAVGGNIGLIYFDAHGDMNTAETTLTGNIHGMHLASLMGYGAPELVYVYGKHTKLAQKNLLHIAGSDFDQAELDLIARESL